MKVLQVWNDIRVSNWWQNFHFWVNYSFNYFVKTIILLCRNLKLLGVNSSHLCLSTPSLWQTSAVAGPFTSCSLVSQLTLKRSLGSPSARWAVMWFKVTESSVNLTTPIHSRNRLTTWCRAVSGGHSVCCATLGDDDHCADRRPAGWLPEESENPLYYNRAQNYELWR